MTSSTIIDLTCEGDLDPDFDCLAALAKLQEQKEPGEAPPKRRRIQEPAGYRQIPFGMLRSNFREPKKPAPLIPAQTFRRVQDDMLVVNQKITFRGLQDRFIISDCGTYVLVWR
jgi:hypothetical protein